MEYAQFIQQTLNQPEYAQLDQFTYDLIVTQFKDCFEFADQDVIIKPLLIQKAIKVIQTMQGKYKNDQNQLQSEDQQLQNSVQEENNLLKQLGEMLGIKYGENSSQETIFQLAFIFNEQNKKISELESLVEAQKSSNQKILALQRYIQSLERINEQQNALLVTYNAENYNLRKETKYAIECAFGCINSSNNSSLQTGKQIPNIQQATMPENKPPIRAPTSTGPGLKDGKKIKKQKAQTENQNGVRSGSCPGSIGSQNINQLLQQTSFALFTKGESPAQQKTYENDKKQNHVMEFAFPDKKVAKDKPSMSEMLEELESASQSFQQVISTKEASAMFENQQNNKLSEPHGINAMGQVGAKNAPTGLNDIELFSTTDAPATSEVQATEIDK